MDREVWQAKVHGVSKSQIQLIEHTHTYVFLTWNLCPGPLFIQQCYIIIVKHY